MLHPYTQGTLITATTQMGRQLRRAYDAAREREGLRVWESPDVLSLDAWLARVWREYANRDPLDAPLLLNPLQFEMLWEKAIRASEAASAEEAALLDLPATVSAAARAWDLLQAWEAPFHPSDFEQTAESAAFAGWKRTVERELRENGWITKSQLPKAISARITTGAIEIPRPVAYTGFHNLPPANRRLFEACDAVERANGTRLNSAARSRVACESPIDELTRAAVWARQMLERQPAASIGIAVRGLAEQADVAKRVLDDILNPGVAFTQSNTSGVFHVSAHIPAAEQPLIACALLTLNLKPGLSISEAGMLLQSPFIGLNRVAGARLAANLRRQGVERVSLRIEAVRHALPDFAKAAGEGPARQRPSQWAVTFSKLLSMAGWPGERTLSPLEYEALEDWKTLLSDLASLDVALPRMDYADALSRLRQIARARRSADPDDDAPVQVMDLREAAGTRWDGLWIAGLDAGAWPQPPRPNPFLPPVLQRAAGMPHSSPEWELADAQHVTTDLLSAATEVICSYARASGEEPLQVSPLIAMLPEASGFPAPPVTALLRVFEMEVPLEMLPPDQARPLKEGTVQRGGMSVLKDQAACPFRAFAIHRLEVRELDEADLGISASERGTVAHDALESLWSELKTQRELLTRSNTEIDELIAHHVTMALNKRLGRRHKSGPLDRARDLEQARCQKLIADWVSTERERADFEVVEREKPHEVEVSGLKLQVKADRIDQLGDGTFAIIDYKTSKNISVKAWEGDRPDEPQLPLYAVKSNRDISAVYFAKLTRPEVNLTGHDGSTLQACLTSWESVVDNLGGSFLRGEAAVDPKDPPQTCQYCHLQLLCRISELKPGAETLNE